jgi:hypothetical protein
MKNVISFYLFFCLFSSTIWAKSDPNTINEQNNKMIRLSTKLFEQNISHETEKDSDGRISIRISGEGDHQLNRISKGLQNSLSVKIIIAPFITNGRAGNYLHNSKTIYLDEEQIFEKNKFILMHEIRHAFFKTKYAADKSDIYLGHIIRQQYLPEETHTGLTKYERELMSFEEIFTYAYQSRLLFSDLSSDDLRLDQTIEKGLRLTGYAISVLSDVIAEIHSNPKIVRFVNEDSKNYTGLNRPGKKVLTYLIDAKKFKVVGPLSGAIQQVDGHEEETFKMLLQSLNNKLTHFKLMEEKYRIAGNNLKNFRLEKIESSIEDLISTARLGLQFSIRSCRTVFK